MTLTLSDGVLEYWGTGDLDWAGGYSENYGSSDLI